MAELRVQISCVYRHMSKMVMLKAMATENAGRILAML